MKRILQKFSVLILCGAFLLAGCSNAPAAETMAEEPAPTTQPADTPEPTAEPPIPCMIVFESDRDGNNEIYVMAPDGSGQTNLTINGADDSDPVWSPDGKEIAFISNRESELGGGQFIYVMAADGSGVRQLSAQPDSKMPDWSPEGSQITFSHNGDIFVVNTEGSSETNLTDSPELDEHPKFSPDGTRIAWMKSSGNETALYVMNADGSGEQQITASGKVFDLEWSVDGRIFTHWEQPDGICFGVVSADGKEVVDAGGKGTIQEFLPFWTLDGQRVEMIQGQNKDLGGEDEEIFLVGEMFPDIFLNLTDNEANDRNPDAPARCGPVPGGLPAQAQPQTDQPAARSELVIGYVIRADNPRKEEQVLKACEELQIDCVRGANISDLVERSVSAVVDVSNRWEVQGSFPEIWDAIGKTIPLYIVDAETHVGGAYNLSVESDSVTVSLEWMFKQMGGKGELVYFNFGNHGYHQELIDALLKQNPGIRATSLPASFDQVSYTEESIAQLVRENPDLGAIWTDGDPAAIFWGLNNMGNEQKLPVALCPARADFLQLWKEKIDGGSSFSGISTISPGGAPYEAVYVAYYMLNGAQINPEMLGGYSGNTLRYDFPVITNENLEEWLGKLGTLQRGDWDALELPPMTPEQIRQAWFLK